MDLILDFTHSYPQDWIRIHTEMTYMDCTDLGGTDMYCSPESVTELEKRIGEYPLKGIHFIDSGNYHYMTRLFTKRIRCPYNLVVFDNHTDCKPSMIPELLSCGAWAKQVLEEDENLQRLILIGPPQAAVDDIETEHREKLVTVSREGLDSDFMLEWSDILMSYPLYFSIDKDVLGKEYAMTNWDQGGMSLDMLKELLRFFFEAAGNDGSKILGIDICGELPEKEASYTEAAQAQEVNRRTNEELIRFYREKLKNFP